MGALIGTVLAVYNERLGGEASADTGVAGTALQFDDASDFNEDGGQVVLPDGSAVSYDSVDFDLQTMTMTVPLVVGVAAGDWIAPWAGDHEDSVRLAEVDVGDGPALVAVVRHSLRSLLPPGTREPGTEETVELADVDGEMQVANIRGKEPGIVGPFIDVPAPGEPGFHVAADGTMSLEADTFTAFTADALGTVRTRTMNFPEIDPVTIQIDGGSGDIRALDLRVYNDLDDLFYTARLTGSGLILGAGGSDAPDIGLVRTGANEVTFNDVSAGSIAVQWGGGAGNGNSRLAANDYVELAKRNADPGAGPTGSVRVYSKVVAGVSKLFAQDDAGGVHALW